MRVDDGAESRNSDAPPGVATMCRTSPLPHRTPAMPAKLNQNPRSLVRLLLLPNLDHVRIGLGAD
jgi:hypothetical protein